MESRLWASLLHFSPPPTFKTFHKFHNKVGKNIGCMAFTMLMLILTMTKLTWQKKPHQKIQWYHTRSNLILKTVHSDVTLQISPQLMFFPQMVVMLASLRDRRLGHRLGKLLRSVELKGWASALLTEGTPEWIFQVSKSNLGGNGPLRRTSFLKAETEGTARLNLSFIGLHRSKRQEPSWSELKAKKAVWITNSSSACQPLKIKSYMEAVHPWLKPSRSSFVWNETSLFLEFLFCQAKVLVYKSLFWLSFKLQVPEETALERQRQQPSVPLQQPLKI